MEIIILGFLAFVGYKLFRLSRRARGEAVRAYIYLERRIRGENVADANAFVDAALYDLRSELALSLIQMAKTSYDNVHDGNLLAVVGHAYRQGLRPVMPFWYRIGAQLAPVTRAIESTYGISRPDVKFRHDLLPLSNGHNGSEDPSASLQSSQFCGDYNKYYNSLLFHVRKRNVPNYNYERDIELMVETFGHNAFEEAFKRGTPSEILAEKLVRKLNSTAS